MKKTEAVEQLKGALELLKKNKIKNARQYTILLGQFELPRSAKLEDAWIVLAVPTEGLSLTWDGRPRSTNTYVINESGVSGPCDAHMNESMVWVRDSD